VPGFQRAPVKQGRPAAPPPHPGADVPFFHPLEAAGRELRRGGGRAATLAGTGTGRPRAGGTRRGNGHPAGQALHPQYLYGFRRPAVEKETRYEDIQLIHLKYRPWNGSRSYEINAYLQRVNLNRRKNEKTVHPADAGAVPWLR